MPLSLPGPELVIFRRSPGLGGPFVARLGQRARIALWRDALRLTPLA